MLWPCFCFVISSQCSTQPDYLNWLSPEPAMAERSAPTPCLWKICSIFSHFPCFMERMLPLVSTKGWPMPVPFLYLSPPRVQFFICHFGLDFAIFLICILPISGCFACIFLRSENFQGAPVCLAPRPQYCSPNTLDTLYTPRTADLIPSDHN